MSAAPDALGSAAATPAGTAPSSAALASDGLAPADRRRRVFEYRDVREARGALRSVGASCVGTSRLASPLRASGAQLPGLPPALVTVTTVRYDGITHDFMMLNPLSGTHATRAAVAQAIAVLREALQSA
jgi:hypothetical protein